MKRSEFAEKIKKDVTPIFEKIWAYNEGIIKEPMEEIIVELIDIFLKHNFILVEEHPNINDPELMCVKIIDLK